MADRVRGDFMATGVERVEMFDTAAHIIDRAAEIDRRIAAALARALVEEAAGVGEKIDAAEEKREADALAIPVHVGGEITELLPALKLGAIVERHHHELRRSLDGGLRIGCSCACDENADNPQQSTHALPPASPPNRVNIEQGFRWRV